MKAALKFIMTVVGLLLIGLCLTTILLFTRFEGLLRDGLTHQAGRILHGEVRMEDMRFDWANQAIVFKGVSLLNPEGFTDREALRIGFLRVTPEPLTLFSRTPGVANIVVEDIQLHLQYHTDGKSNLGVFRTYADEWADRQETSGETVWGRPMRVERIQTESADVEVESLTPPAAPYTQTVAAHALESPGGEEAITGARTIHVLLQSFLDALRGTEGLPAELKSVLDQEETLAL